MIFAKTNLGRMAAFDPHSLLPSHQKSLLRLIDGRTRLTEINRALAPSVCSIDLIEALLDQDLIQLAKSEAALHNRPGNDGSEKLELTRHLSLVGYKNDDTVPAELSALAEPERPSYFGTAGAEHSAQYQERLQAAKDSLVSFVIAHLQEDANAVLQEVDQIAHNDQLKATIVAVLSMANQSSKADPGQTQALNQCLLQLSDE